MALDWGLVLVLLKASDLVKDWASMTASDLVMDLALVKA